MRTVLTYGTFDLFHIGHLRLLERAAALGDQLFVGVSTDEFNATKGKKSLMPFDQRSQIVAALRCVDRVFPEGNWAQKIEDVRRFRADVLVMGDDWTGRFDDLKGVCEVVYVPRTQGISSTELKECMRTFGASEVEDLKKALDMMQIVIKQLEG